jgi:hypothetical protein
MESLRISQNEMDRAGVDSSDIDYELAVRRIKAEIQAEEQMEIMQEQLAGAK